MRRYTFNALTEKGVFLRVIIDLVGDSIDSVEDFFAKRWILKFVCYSLELL